MSLGVEGCPGIVHTAFEMCHVVDFPPSAMMTDRDAVDGKVAAYLRTGERLLEDCQSSRDRLEASGR